MVTPDEKYLSWPDGPVAFRERCVEAVYDGCSNIGGYTLSAPKIHPSFRDSSKSPDNDFDGIGSGEYDAIVISHIDLDGVATASLYNYQYDNVKLLYADHSGTPVEDVLHRVAVEIPDCPVYIVDMQPQTSWNRYLERFHNVSIRDHHPYNPNISNTVDYAHESYKSTTEIVLQEDIDTPDSHIAALAEAAGIRDCWRSSHPKFQRYGLLSIAADIFDRDILVERFTQEGTGILSDPSLFDALKRLNCEKWLRTDVLLSEPDLHDQRSVDGVDFMTVYGHADTNRVCHQFMEHFDVDLVANVFPFTNDDKSRIGFRSSDDSAGRVAFATGGGGHAQAGSGSIRLKSDTPQNKVKEAATGIEQILKLT